MTSISLRGAAARLLAVAAVAFVHASPASAASVSVEGQLTSSGATNSCTYSQLRQSSSGNWTTVCGTGGNTITFSPKVCGSVCTSYTSLSETSAGVWTVTGCVPASSAPNVTLTAPLTGAVIPEGTAITLSAVADPCAQGGAISKVEFWANGALISGATVTSAPYNFSWTPVAGSYAIEGRATEGALVGATATANIYVNATPTVQITAPLDGSAVNTPVTLTATANDPAGSIQRVEYHIQSPDALIGTSTAGPDYAYTWAAPSCTTCTIVAKAIDDRNTVGTSTAVTFTTVLPKRMNLRASGAAGDAYPYIAPAALSFAVEQLSGSPGDGIKLYEVATNGSLTYLGDMAVDPADFAYKLISPSCGTSVPVAPTCGFAAGSHKFVAKNSGAGVMAMESNPVTVQVDAAAPPAAEQMCPAEQTMGTAAGTSAGSPGVSEMGAATYGAPLVLPPGIAGLAPQLGIGYNSQGGNGLLGAGFSLQGLSVIHRCAKNYFTDNVKAPIGYGSGGGTEDALCLDGQRLVLVSGSRSGNAEYRTERESYSKIESFAQGGFTGPAYFKVQAKSGQIMYYGFKFDEAGTPDDSVLRYNPATAGKETVRTWALYRVEDRSGNKMLFSYTKSDTVGTQRPLSIQYAFHDGAYSNRVDFTFTGSRPDVIQGYDSGSQSSSEDNRLTQIKTWTDGVAVKQYNLSYAQSVATNRSLLQQLQECSGDGQLCYAPLDFDWTDASANVHNFTGTGSVSWVYSTPRTTSTMAVDLNGDGKTDLITQNDAQSSWNVCMYTDAQANCSTWTSPVRSGLNGRDDLLKFADFDGDGKADLVHVSSSTQDFALVRSTGNGFSSEQTLVSPSGWKGLDGGYSYTVGDFDGDGRADLALYNGSDQAGFGKWIFCSLKTNGLFSCSSEIALSSGQGSANSGFDLTVADFNGDGRADFGFHDNNSPDWHICLSTSNAIGTFSFSCGGLVTATNSDAPKTHVADVNGDGLADLLAPAADFTVVNGHWTVCLSKGDGTFDCLDWQNGPKRDQRNTVMGDFDGDGRTDVAWYEDTGTVGWRVCLARGRIGSNADFNCGGFAVWGSSGLVPKNDTVPLENIRTGDFNGDGKTDIGIWVDGTTTWKLGIAGGTRAPDLISRVTNGLQATTDFLYEPLTEPTVYAKDPDASATYPVINVQSPMYVVSYTGSRTSSGAFPYSEIEYSYAGLQGHAQGGGMSGFRQRAAHDMTSMGGGLSNLCTETETETSWADRRVGALKRVTRKRASDLDTVLGVCAGSAKLAETTNTWTPRIANTFSNLTDAWVNPGANTKIFENFVTSSVDKRWEIGASIEYVTATTTTPLSSIDAYGNPKSVSATASDGFGKTTTSTYFNTPSTWIIGRLHRATVTASVPGGRTNVNNNTQRVSEFEYDTQGRLTAEVIEPDRTGTSQYLRTEYTLDVFGNHWATRVTGGSGSGVDRTSVTAYCPDPLWGMFCTADGRFPTFIQNAAQHLELRAYDKRFGGVTSSTDPNNLQTTWQYDKLGRKFCEARPDSSTTGWSWAGDTNGLKVSTYDSSYPVKNSGVPQAKSEQYVDRIGRETLAQTRAFDGSWSSVTTVYDPRSRKTKITKPYASTYSDNVFTYDDLDRVVTETAPAGYSATHSYSGFQSSVTVNGGQSGAQTTTRTVNSRGEVETVVDALGGELKLQYDHFGNLEKKYTGTLPQGGSPTTTLIYYNARGQKTQTVDPDQGTWSYQYNSAGELTQQTDALASVTTFQYDDIGRMYYRDAAGYISQWQYDSGSDCGSKTTGRLCEAIAPGGWGSTRYKYDNLGRLSSKKLTTFFPRVFEKFIAYDGLSRVRQVVYPYTGLTLDHSYNTQGYLDTISEAGGGPAIWQAISRYADGQINQYRFKAQTVTKTYDAAARPASIVMSGAQNLSVTFDALGNLTSRADSGAGLSTESFAYDKLNRLLSVTGPVAKTYTYDSLGNLKTKDGVALSYVAGTHRVDTMGTKQFQYDANGRVEYDSDFTFSTVYYDNGDLSSVYAYQGDETHSRDIFYDASGQRTEVMESKQLDTTFSVRSYYFSDGITPFFEEELHSPATPGQATQDTWRHYINTPEGVVGMITIANDLTGTRNDIAFVRDHLGSTVGTISNAGIEKVGYDAWGTPRNADGTVNNAADLTLTNRTYTGHEQYDDAGIVNMNGRIYMPGLGRVLAADPIVQEPLNLQNYNRYSYVNNNPLTLSDPTGYSWWKNNGQGALKAVGAAVVSWITYGAASQWVMGAYASVSNVVEASAFTATTAEAAAVTSSGIGSLTVANVAGVAGGAAAGFASGGIMGGNLNSALTGALSGALSGGVSEYFGSKYPIERVAANSVVGGITSRINGGSFADGFRSSLFNSLLTYANVAMREYQIELSNRDPELRSDGTGYSRGLFRDGFKLGGGRYDPANPLACSFLGCQQKGPGSIFGHLYASGSFVDMVVESFAGPHDHANMSWFYNEQGFIRPLTTMQNFMGEGLGNYTSSLVFATPFALAAIREQTFYVNTSLRQH